MSRKYLRDDVTNVQIAGIIVELIGLLLFGGTVLYMTIYR